MVRYGYANCSSCHVSPSGGGINTNYGDAISREVLSFIKQPEQKPKPFNLGGDIRSLGFVSNTPQALDAAYFLMQADLEAAAGTKFYQVDVSAGEMRQPDKSYKFDSRRYYLLVRPWQGVGFRVGKFQKAYGINIPEHAVAIKRGLGMDEGSETQNVEASYANDIFGAIVTYIDNPTNGHRDFAGTASAFLFNRFKLGGSLKSDSYGFWAISGWTQKAFTLTEFDRTKEKEFWYCKEAWEFHQGAIIYLSQDASKKDVWDWQAYGVGLQLFPRSHIEVNLQYQKQASLNQKFYDYGLIMTHIYL